MLMISTRLRASAMCSRAAAKGKVLLLWLVRNVAAGLFLSMLYLRAPGLTTSIINSWNISNWSPTVDSNTHKSKRLSPSRASRRIRKRHLWLMSIIEIQACCPLYTAVRSENLGLTWRSRTQQRLCTRHVVWLDSKNDTTKHMRINQHEKTRERAVQRKKIGRDCGSRVDVSSCGFVRAESGRRFRRRHRRLNSRFWFRG